MANFYLDIETTGINPINDKIISIQTAELDRHTGKQIGQTKIFKEWDNGEKSMLNDFIQNTNILCSYPFDFVVIGNNLTFDRDFLLAKTEKYDLPRIDILKKPHIDIKSILVLMNRGEFKNSGLDNFTSKKLSGDIIPNFYAEKKYNEIENYVKSEITAFVELFVFLYKEFPQLNLKIHVKDK